MVTRRVGVLQLGLKEPVQRNQSRVTGYSRTEVTNAEIIDLALRLCSTTARTDLVRHLGNFRVWKKELVADGKRVGLELVLASNHSEAAVGRREDGSQLGVFAVALSKARSARRRVQDARKNETDMGEAHGARRGDASLLSTTTKDHVDLDTKTDQSQAGR